MKNTKLKCYINSTHSKTKYLKARGLKWKVHQLLFLLSDVLCYMFFSLIKHLLQRASQLTPKTSVLYNSSTNSNSRIFILMSRDPIKSADSLRHTGGNIQLHEQFFNAVQTLLQAPLQIPRVCSTAVNTVTLTSTHTTWVSFDTL